MENDILTPIIIERENEILIMGSANSLLALAESIIRKVKIGTNINVTFVDGINKKPIKIFLDSDIINASI